MNFEFSEEQVLLKESIQRWAQDNYSFDQRGVAAANQQGFSADNWATFAELGWLSVPFAEEHGGFGGGTIDIAAIMQEFGAALVVEPIASTLILFGGLLERSDNAALKAQLIPSVIEGKLLGAAAISESQARFDLSNVTTTATADGDNYVLNGNKAVVLGAASADKIIVAARTSGKQTDEAGLSLFVVDAQADGLSMNGYTLMDGQQAADIELSDVTVAADQSLCAIGAGYQLMADMLQAADMAFSAEALGIMEHLNKTTVEYTKTRKQFGVQISKFQALQHRMVDTFMAAEQTKSMLFGVLAELNDEATSSQQAAMFVNALRTMVAKNGKLVGDEAIQMHGGMGLTDEMDIGHYVKRLMMINLMFGNGDFFQKRFNHLAYSA